MGEKTITLNARAQYIIAQCLSIGVEELERRGELSNAIDAEEIGESFFKPFYGVV